MERGGLDIQLHALEIHRLDLQKQTFFSDIRNRHFPPSSQKFLHNFYFVRPIYKREDGQNAVNVI